MIETPPTLAKHSYASVNGLEMYYEIHGADRPLVLLHGVLGTINLFEQLLPSLSQ
jgi:pimeloyl-ACP methyl ester carboxylesterase